MDNQIEKAVVCAATIISMLRWLPIWCIEMDEIITYFFWFILYMDVGTSGLIRGKRMSDASVGKKKRGNRSLPSDHGLLLLLMGAVHMEYKKYLLGSLLGILPHTITYPIMGMSIQDIRSPKFMISLCAELAYILATSAVYTLY